MELGEFAPAETASTVTEDCFTVEFKGSSTEPAAFQLGAPHPGTDAFDDNGAF